MFSFLKKEEYENVLLLFRKNFQLLKVHFRQQMKLYIFFYILHFYSRAYLNTTVALKIIQLTISIHLLFFYITTKCLQLSFIFKFICSKHFNSTFFTKKTKNHLFNFSKTVIIFISCHLEISKLYAL